MSVTIRVTQANVENAPVILELTTRLFRELTEDPAEFESLDMSGVVKELAEQWTTFTAFLAWNEQEECVGLITLVETFAIYAGGRYVVIPEMFVAPAYRSRGVGRQLLQAVKDYGRQQGWQRIDVTAPAEPQWQRTVQFYEREGFVFTGPKMRLMLRN